MINPQKAVQWYRNKYSSIGEDDYDIYEKLKKWYPNQEFSENPFTAQEPQQIQIPTEEELDKKANPGFFKKLLTANLAGAYADESNWWAEAYNKSMAGTLYQALHGEAKYDVEDIDREWYDEVGQFFVGLISPVDLATFIGTAGVGGIAAKGITSGPLKNYALKGLTKMVGENAARNIGNKVVANSFGRYLASSAAIESGFSLGTYGAAGAALQDQAQQSLEIADGTRAPGDRDYLQTTWNAVKHGATSAVLGAGAGFVTKGLMAPKFAKAKMSVDPKFANKVTKITMNPVGQVAAEGTVFGTGQLAERSLMHGEQIDFDDFLESIFMNTGIVGGLRAGNVAFGKITGKAQDDVARYKAAKKDFYGSLYKEAGYKGKVSIGKEGNIKYKEYEALEKVEQSLSEAGLPTPREILQKKANLKTEAETTILGIDALEKGLSDFNVLLDKIGQKDISKLPKDVQAKILKDSGTYVNSLYEMYSDMKINREATYDMYAKELPKGETLSKKQKAEIDKTVDIMKSDLEDASYMINAGALNKPEALKLAQEKYAQGFNVSTKKVGDKYETVLKTPAGNNIPLKQSVRLHQTEAQAKAFGDVMSKRYSERLTGKDSKSDSKYGLGDEVEVIPVNPTTGKPIFIGDSVNKKRVSKAVAEQMINEGTAKYPKDVNVAPGVNMSSRTTKQFDSLVLSEDQVILKSIEKKLSTLASSEVFPMNEPTFLNKKVYAESIINKTKPKFTASEDKLIKQIESKQATNLIKKSVPNMNEVDKIAYVDFAVQRIASSRKVDDPVKYVAQFLSELKDRGKDLSKVNIDDYVEFFDKYIPNRTTNKHSNALSIFSKFLITNEYIKPNEGQALRDYAKRVVNEFNEYGAKGKNPAKKGIRKFVVNETAKSKDTGLEIVGELGANYYVRNSEINKIAKFLKEGTPISEILKKEGKDFYLDLKGDLTKYKTFDRIVWVDDAFANKIQAYINAGGALEGKVTKISQLIKGKNKTNNPGSAFYDLRRRGKSVKDLGDMGATRDYLFGHERTRIDKFYNIKNTQDLINLQKKLHKEIGSHIPKDTKDFRVLSKGEIPATKEVHQARQAALSKRYPELTFEMVREFKDNNIPKDAVGYLEMAENHTVAVKLGKAPSDVIPHEVSHYAFKLLNVMSKSTNMPKQAQKALKLYNDAKKIFVNEKGKFVEEDAVLMIGKAIDKQLEAPMMSKATGFFKRFNTWLKSVFNKQLSKDEIAYALGRRIIKRQGITESPLFTIAPKEFRTVQQSYANGTKLRNAISRELRVAQDKFGLNTLELTEFVAEKAGIPNPKEFKIKLPKDELSLEYSEKAQQLLSFDNVLKGLNLQEYVGKKDILKQANLITEIARLRLDRDITKDKQMRLLRDIWGVEEGNIYSASYEKLKDFKEYITQEAIVSKDNLSLVTREEINAIHLNVQDAKPRKLLKEGLMLAGPIHTALESIGFKKLASKLRNHYNLQETNAAGLLRYSENSKKILGGNVLTRESRLSKINNKMTMALDNNGEMLLGLMDAVKLHGKKLPKGEAKIIKGAETYFNKAIKSEWWNTVKNVKEGDFLYRRGDGLAKKNKDGSYKYINTETKEGQIALQYIENIMNTLGKDKYESALKQRLNEAEFESINDKNGIKFIKDGIYMTRVLTNEGKLVLGVEGKARDRAINKIATEIAVRRAKKIHGDKYKDKVFDEMENARMEAEIQYNDRLHFNPGKITTKYLKDRFTLQDLFVEDSKGKLVRTYEYQFDKTVTPYVQGMSKFYATLEMFPEAIQGIKAGNGTHKIFSQASKDARGVSAKEINWAKEVVDKQLGTEKSGAPYELIFRSMEGAARIVAKIGLSFPTAGTKNILTGTTQTVFAHRFQDVVRGFRDVISMDAENYNKALDSNAFSVGNVIYQGTNKIDRILDATAFKAGFMKPTENFNRLLAIAASKYDQIRQFKRLSMYPPEHKLHKRAMDRLKTFYFLTNKEIATRKKYSTTSDVKLDRSLSEFNKAKRMRDVQVINNKLNTYAHVNTQGSSADLFMPKFAGKEGVRPLTLFKRMAFAATDNTIRNLNYSKRNKNLIRPLMGFTATYLSGSALIGIYSSLLGTQMPKENSDWFRRFWTTMWKGEMLGLMSEAISPYDNGVAETMNPAIIRTMGSIAMELGQLWEGKSNFAQFGEGIFRTNVSLYNNTMKIIERRNNPLNKDRVRISKLYQDYKEEMNMPGPKELEKNTRSPYYEDFKNAFFLGTEEEFAKQLYTTFFAVAHDFVRQGDSMQDAFKKSNSIIKSKFKTMNPNKASLIEKDKDGKKNAIKFLKWIQRHPDAKNLTARLYEVESEYKDRLKRYTKDLNKYAKQFNVSNYYNDYDWTLRY